MVQFMVSAPVRGVALCGALALLGGCATTQISAQWIDPAMAGSPLRGAKVLVVCEAVETSVRHICQDRFAARLNALGVQAIAGPDASAPAADPGAPAMPYLPAARAAGAVAVWISSVAPDSSYVSPGPSISFGLGGFGGGNIGGGLGVSVPVGGAQLRTAYGTNSNVVEVASNRVMWSGKLVTPAADSLSSQLDELARSASEAAHKSGLF